MDKGKVKSVSRTSIGVVLVAIGVVYLVSNLFGLGGFLIGLAWPLFVVVPGLGLFVLMALAGRSRGGWLAVPASVVTTVGLLLTYANLFNYWESWAYTWTLLFGAAGMGILISHYWSGRPEKTDFGRFLVKASMFGLIGFGLFFELFIFTSGVGRSPISRLAWPAILILIGGYLVLRNRGDGPALARRIGARRVRSKSEAAEVIFEPIDAGNSKAASGAEAEQEEARQV